MGKNHSDCMNNSCTEDIAKIITEIITEMTCRKLLCASVESFTGGGFGAVFTEFSGASACYVGGVITYSTQQKIALAQVPQKIIIDYGVYSHHCVRAMAEGGRKKLKVDIAISFTGVAGPDPQEGCVPGTVFLGVASSRGIKSYEYSLLGTRSEIRNQAIYKGFLLLREEIDSL